jgi:sugar lactone lactonase YvrE
MARLLACLAVVAAVSGCALGTPATGFGLGAKPGAAFGVLDHEVDACQGSPYAIFAKSSLVDLTIGGSHHVIDGDVHTNCVFKLVGADNVVKGKAETAQGYFIHGQGLEASVAEKTAELPFPFQVDPAAITPTFTFDGGVNLTDRPEVWEAPGKLKEGVYLATGPIALSGEGITGKVTLIGSQVQLHGSRFKLEAYAKGLLAHATSTGLAIQVSGRGHQLTGLVSGPQGKVGLDGSGMQVSGMILADVFELAGEGNHVKHQDTGYCAGVHDTGDVSSPGFKLWGLVSTFAGSLERRQPSCVPITDGTRLDTSFRWPKGLCWDPAGNMVVADYSNGALRKITPGGRVTTLAAGLGRRLKLGATPTPALETVIGNPVGVAADAQGNLYFSANNVIGKYDAQTGMVSTFAGGHAISNYKEPPLHDGIGQDASFNQPHGLAIRGNTLYVADVFSYAIRKVDLTTREVTTLAGGKPYTKTLPSGTVEYFMTHGYQDGTGQEAIFGQPYDVDVDSHGNVLMVDTGNRCLRKITPEGVVTTVAGDMSQSMCEEYVDDPEANTTVIRCHQPYGNVDGKGPSARFTSLQGLALDAWDNAYVVDSFNNNVRRVTPDGTVTTLAGSDLDGAEAPAQTNGAVDGLGTRARFQGPQDVLVDNQGVLYVSDGFNNCIRRIQ